MISELIGKALVKIEGGVGDGTITFESDEGEKWSMYHEQDCSECVTVNDICGDMKDLIGTPILQAEESSSEPHPECKSESYTWTFYRIATMRGQVVIRWLGVSNGYYSESVRFSKL